MESNIIFFNVGRQDAILLQSQEQTILIDGGNYNTCKTLVPKLRRLGVTQLDYYIATHGHSDHIGGVALIISAFNPKKIIVPHNKVLSKIRGLCKTSIQKKAFVNSEKFIGEVGDEFNVGDFKFKCIGPIEIIRCATFSLRENYNSLIYLVSIGEKRMLLAGDTSSSILSKINRLDKGILKAGLYKNAHHNGSTTKEVLKMIRPDCAIVCNSKKVSNRYRHTLVSIGCTTVVSTAKNDGRTIKISYSSDNNRAYLSTKIKIDGKYI